MVEEECRTKGRVYERLVEVWAASDGNRRATAAGGIMGQQQAAGSRQRGVA
jgi:hypothetical protein